MKPVIAYVTNFLDFIVSHFGYNHFTDLVNSMVHSKLLLFTIPASVGLFAIVEQWLGVSSAIFIAFGVMAAAELLTGLLGARAKGQKIESRKFGRFGIKILVWLCLLMVANSFKVSYVGAVGVQGWMIYQLFNWLHGTLLVYVSLEYIISILENLAKITGKSNNRLITFLNKQIDKMFGAAETALDTPKDKDEKPEEEAIEEPQEGDHP